VVLERAKSAQEITVDNPRAAQPGVSGVEPRLGAFFLHQSRRDQADEGMEKSRKEFSDRPLT